MRKLLSGMFLLAVGAAAEAATITVNSLADVVADDGACTLREAAASADGDAASGVMAGECGAGLGADVIEFGAPLSGVITLGSAITVTSSVEIDGPVDRPITVGGFSILFDDGSAATDQEIKIRRLTLSTLLTFEENALVHACTITGLPPAPSALVAGSDGKLLVSNSTISGNTFMAGGAAVGGPGPVVLLHTTITDNTGDALIGPGSPTIVNSVIAGNTGSACLVAPAGNFGNFFGDASCDGVAGGDPMVAGLADNGGSTLTHGLLVGSPLRDAADDAGCLATDQRGHDRALDGDGDLVETCDVGAVEVEDDMTVPVLLQSFTIE